MSKENISIIIIILLLAGAGYVWYTGSGGAPDTAEEQESRESFEKRLTELRRLKDLKLDTSVLDDPLFKSLVAPPEPTVSEVKPGRTNPFLSIQPIIEGQ